MCRSRTLNLSTARSSLTVDDTFLLIHPDTSRFQLWHLRFNVHRVYRNREWHSTGPEPVAVQRRPTTTERVRQDGREPQ